MSGVSKSAAGISESDVEDAALGWLAALGWTVARGPDVAPDAPNAVRGDYGEVVLRERLQAALARLNPDLPDEALHDARRKLTRPEGTTLVARNRAFHRMVVDGVTVEYRDRDGAIRGAQVRVIDFGDRQAGDRRSGDRQSGDRQANGRRSSSRPANGQQADDRQANGRQPDHRQTNGWQSDDGPANDWLAINQFTVVENRHERRPDVVLFVNGLPLAVIELKNPADESATLWSAHRQLQTCKAEIPSLFVFNAALIVSDGLEARIGTLTAGREWFKPWRTITGEGLADPHLPQLQVMLEGVCAPRRFLALVRDFIVFEDGRGSGRGASGGNGGSGGGGSSGSDGSSGGSDSEASGSSDGSSGGGTGGGNEGSAAGLAKKMAGYHQFHAVETAVAETLRAAKLQRQRAAREVAEEPGRYESGRSPGGVPGDRRIGVVWHTQGSGKSLTMAFYAGRIVREPAMENPTVVVLTDRNDLDDQLFATFARCADLLRQPPVQAASRADLRARLAVESGGVVFTTIQKFFPEETDDRHPLAGEPALPHSGIAEQPRQRSPLARNKPVPRPSAPLAGAPALPRSGIAERPRQRSPLSDRRNVVVIADEAHRSQYDFIDGYARHMRDALPNASFIGFTGTPIELEDASTRAVFGDHISVYDVRRAVEDGATVPIYYESRLARLTLDERERPNIDPGFEEATEGEEIERRERLKTRWAQLETVVGASKRLALVARDVVDHFEKRLEAMHGKAMVVCMSRRICIDLYRELVRLRPEWRGDGDDAGACKVVMTGAASDPPDWQPHIRNKARREALAKRFRDPADPLRIVLVRDMWLTGFDAPSLHTMYVDKPMRGHGLMQAIARVNRVFGDKPGGLVVDYLGLAHELKRALATYTGSGGTGRAALDQGEAVAAMREKYEICCGLFHGFDRSAWSDGTPAQRLGLLPAAQEHVLAQEDGKERCLLAVRDLSRAFALAVPHEEALRIRDEVSFFQAVRAALAKRAGAEARSEEALDHAVRRIVSRAVAPDGVVDVFAAAGLAKPDLSILSDEFLAEVRDMPQRNLAVELLRKLLKGELSARRRKNVVQARSFAEMLEQTIRRYRSRAVEAAQVIEELIGLAREMRAANARGETLGLSEDELAFYDALGVNDSAVRVLGDETLRGIARELVETVRANVTIDWTLRENVRAHLRRLVRRVLRRHGYPPDRQESATRTVLEQAEALSAGWAV